MLTDAFIKNVKAAESPKKYADGGGLFLYVPANGSKLWRMTYRYNRKSKLLSFGKYPAVTLKMARERRDAAKKLLAEGIDPSRHKKAVEAAKLEEENRIFENLAREWHQTKTGHIGSESYKIRLMRRMELYLFPTLGKMPISMIEAQDILAAVKPLVERGKLLIAKKMLEQVGRIFRYAVATGRCKHNIAADLRGALPTVQVTHRAAIKDTRMVGKLLLDIDNYVGSYQIQCAIKILPLVFLRSGELGKATWDEIDFEKKEWRIPASRMKMKEPHIVPLSRQVLEILADLHKFSGNYNYVFPSIRTLSKPIGHSSMLNALRLMGYTKEEHSIHGFRARASTLLNELGFNSDWIERQLAHQEHNGVRAAYNYAQYLPERHKMMQVWADYCDELKEKARPEYEKKPMSGRKTREYANERKSFVPNSST